MSDNVKPSEVKHLLLHDSIENYKWKGFLRGGCFPIILLESIQDNREVIGKIVPSPTEGEWKHWPKLQHSNLNCLIDTMNTEYEVKMFISPAVGKCISNVIKDASFTQHPLCFLRKKQYAKGILLGLDYMHHNGMYVLNLSHSNVRVSNFTDEAIICDFSCTVNKKKIAKKLLPASVSFMPPEIQKAKGQIYCFSIDIWACGVLFLQIFTQHLLPRQDKVMNSIDCLDWEILRKANPGACFQSDDVSGLKSFLQNILLEDPKLRCSAEQVFKSNFLQINHNRLDEPARSFWKAYEESKSESPSSLLDDNYFLKKLQSEYLSSECDTANEVLDELLNDVCPQDPMYKIQIGTNSIPRPKSEPINNIYVQEPNPYTRESVSFPALKRDDSRTCKEDDNSVNELYELEENMSNELDDSAILSELLRDMEIEESPYDIFLTEWEADISAVRENTIVSRSNKNKNGEDKNSFSSCATSEQDNFTDTPKDNDSTVDVEYEYISSDERVDKMWEYKFGYSDSSGGTTMTSHTDVNYLEYSKEKNAEENVCGADIAILDSSSKCCVLGPCHQPYPVVENDFSDISCIIDSSEYSHSQERINYANTASNRLKTWHNHEIYKMKKLKIGEGESYLSKLINQQNLEDADSARKEELEINGGNISNLNIRQYQNNADHRNKYRLSVNENRTSKKKLRHNHFYAYQTKKDGNCSNGNHLQKPEILQKQANTNRKNKNKLAKSKNNSKLKICNITDGNNSEEFSGTEDDSSKLRAHPKHTDGSCKLKNKNHSANEVDLRSRDINNSYLDFFGSRCDVEEEPSDARNKFASETSSANRSGKKSKLRRKWYHGLCIGCKK